MVFALKLDELYRNSFQGQSIHTPRSGYLEGVLHELGDVIHAGVRLPPRLSVVLKIRHSVQIPLQRPEIFLKMLGRLKRIKANQTF